MQQVRPPSVAAQGKSDACARTAGRNIRDSLRYIVADLVWGKIKGEGDTMTVSVVWCPRTCAS